MKTILVKSGKITKDEFLLDDYGIDHDDFSVFAIVFGEKDGNTDFSLGFGVNLEEAKSDALRVLEEKLT